MPENKIPLRPLFIPRFCLTSNEIVGVELIIRQGRRNLSAGEAAIILESNVDKKHLLSEISASLKDFCIQTNRSIYLSCKIPFEFAVNSGLISFINEIIYEVPEHDIEIILDGGNVSPDDIINISSDFFYNFQKIKRRCIKHKHPLEFNKKDIIRLDCNAFKLSHESLFKLREDLTSAKEGRKFIDTLCSLNSDIIVDGIYSKSELAYAILMGVQFGQGYFLSRELPVGNKLTKNDKLNYLSARHINLADFSLVS